MAITIHGDATAALILPADLKREKPRTLRLAFLSKKEMREWQRQLSDAKQILDTAARDAAYDALLAEVVRGWANIPGEFSVAGISEHYTLPEFMELLELIPMAMVPGPEDLKKSAAPS